MVAVDTMRHKLAEAKASAVEARRDAVGALAKTEWVVFFVFLLIVLAIAQRLPAREDPVLRRLAQAPEDDEGRDPAEEAAVSRARAEPSTPWPQAKQELAGPEP